jgi:hypothetical protein
VAPIDHTVTSVTYTGDSVWLPAFRAVLGREAVGTEGRTIYPQITQIAQMESLDLTRSHRDTKGAKKL